MDLISLGPGMISVGFRNIALNPTPAMFWELQRCFSVSTGESSPAQYLYVKCKDSTEPSSIHWNQHRWWFLSNVADVRDFPPPSCSPVSITLIILVPVSSRAGLQGLQSEWLCEHSAGNCRCSSSGFGNKKPFAMNSHSNPWPQMVVHVCCLCGSFMVVVHVCLTDTEKGSLSYFKQIFQSL